MQTIPLINLLNYYDHMPNRWEAELRLSLWAPYFILMGESLGVERKKGKNIVLALGALVKSRKLSYQELIYHALEGRLCLEIPSILERGVSDALKSSADYLLTGRELIEIPAEVRSKCIDSAKVFFDQYMRLVEKQQERKQSILRDQPEKVVT